MEKCNGTSIPAPAPDIDVAAEFRGDYILHFNRMWQPEEQSKIKVKVYNMISARGVEFHYPWGDVLDVRFKFEAGNPPAPSPFMNLVLQSLIQGAAGYVVSKIPAPAKFDRCVADVKAKGTAVNPYAVCHAALKKGADK